MTLTYGKIFLVLAAGFALTTNSMGQILIDNFSVPTSGTLSNAGSPNPSSETDSLTILSQTASRMISVSGTGNTVNGSVASGDLSYAAAPPTSPNQIDISYTNFLGDFSAVPILTLNFASIQGGGTVLYFFTSTTGTTTTIGGLSPVPAESGSPSSLSIDLRTLAGYDANFLNGLNSVEVGFAGNSGSFFGLHVSNISFTAAPVPEPSTYGLLLASLLVGFLWRRKLSARA